MGNPFKEHTAHSAEHFGDTRDHWWNADFLRLLAVRFDLGAIGNVLDVGCGIGHWGALLASVMGPDVRITGVDREADWVAEASSRAEKRGIADRFSYQRAEVERLPFADASFDLVTCQTVLIHVADPRVAIAEMARVTRPGGLVLVAEPNNLTESLVLDSITTRASVDDVVSLVRLHLTCERGKVALGEGDNSLGDRVPGMFTAGGLVDVQVFVNDKASALSPPYATAAERAFVEQMRDDVARGLWNWSEAETRRLFLAGGGDEAAFDGAFATALGARQAIVRGVDDGSYHGIVGGLFFVIGGRKPG